MKILLVEDNVYADEIAGCLERKGHEVKKARDLLLAHCFITIDPGIKAFDIVIFDLNMPYPQENILEDMGLKIETEIAGWEYITQIILKKYPECKERLIIYSAYTKRLLQIVGEDEFSTLKVVNKSASDIVEQMLRYIEEICK